MTDTSSNRSTECFIQSLLNGQLSEADAAAYLKILKDSPDELERLACHLDMDSDLRELAFVRPQEKPVSVGLLSEEDRQLLAVMVQAFNLPEPLVHATPNEPVVDEQESRTLKRPLKPADTKRFDRFSKFVFGSFFTLLLVIGLVWTKQNWIQPNSLSQWKYRPLATVGAMVDPVFSDEESRVKPGQTLSVDDLRLESGIVELTTIDGVNLILEGPIDFRMLSARKTFCRRGKISAVVPPKGKGFEISSPNLRVIDLGTEFVVEIQPERSEVHTIKGKVEVVDLASQKTPVTEGKGLRLIPEKGEFLNIHADPGLFTAASQVREAFAHFLVKKEQVEKNQVQKVLSLPGTMVQFQFDGSSQVVSNSARSGQLDGVAYRTRSGDGQYGKQQALGFFEESSRVELSIPQNLHSMTLLATIKPMAMDQFVHCILVSRTNETGNIVWQWTREGQLQLGIRSGSTRFVSAPCFHPRNLGAWYTIATVVDAQQSEIRHYLDGREIGRGTFENMPEIRPGQLTLGNGFWNTKTLSQRRMNGWIDSFYLFDRVLSEQEIGLMSQ